MVSTRGTRSKFAVGEKVLCYEPDPTKARVLYDSKVLEVIVKTDKDGRKAVEYLIHFQGWNSSWDRYVSEEFVLKHTDENWRLQRKLAEKAQLRPGAYLYRRDHKEPKLSKGYLTEQRDIQHNIVASSTSCVGSVSSHSVHSIDTNGKDDCKRKTASSKQKMRMENEMDDKHTLNSNSANFNAKSICSRVRKDGVSVHSGMGEGGLEFDNNGYTVDGEDGYDGDNYDKSGEIDLKVFNDNDNPENNNIRVGSDCDRCMSNNCRDPIEHSVVGYSEENNFTLEISDVMKEILQLDNELIKNGNKLVHLPAHPNVVEILESYVRDYTISQVCGTPEKPHPRYKPQPCHQNNPLDLEQINRSVNICREVADGVRVYFDFTLSGLLLYSEEREQYEQRNNLLRSKETCPTSWFATATVSKGEANGKVNPADYSVLQEPSNCLTNQDIFMHLDHRAGISVGKKYSRTRHTSLEVQECKQQNEEITNKEIRTPDVMPDVSSNATCFPLLSKEEPDNAAHEKLSSVTSNSSLYLSQSGNLNIPYVKEALSARNCDFDLSDFQVSQILDWHLVPESMYDTRPVVPSLVYGAVHLARLFVKLPDLLASADIPAKKLKIVLQHLQMILRYLEKNKSWFGENVYQDSLIFKKS